VGITYASVERITRYEYDGAGNIVRVVYGEQAEAPSITQLTPAFVNRGGSLQMTAIGEHLLGAEVLAELESVTISRVNASSEPVTFTVAASAQAPLGNATLRFITGLGEISQDIVIVESSPAVTSNPNPISIPHDAVATTITFTFTAPRLQNETYNIIVADTTIATATRNAVTILEGQRTMAVTLSGLTRGITQLEFTEPTQLLAYQFPIYVETPFLDLLDEFPDIRQRSLLSSDVGIVVQDTQQALDSTFASSVGVVLGVDQIDDDSLYTPSVGVVLGVDQIDDDSLYTPPVGITVADDNPLSDRELFAQAVGITIDNDRVDALYTDPIDTVVGQLVDDRFPLPAVSRGSVAEVEINGANLQAVQGIAISPDAGLIQGAFSVSADGGVLTLPLTIDAVAGTYEITLMGSQGPIDTRTGLPIILTVE